MSEVEQTVRTFSEIGKALTSTLDIKEVLRIILEKTSQLVQPSSWALLLANDEQTELAYEILINDPSIDRTRPVPMGEGLAGWVAKHRTPLLWSSQGASQTLPNSVVIRPEITSVLGLPLLCQGRLLGVIELKKRAPRKDYFTEQDLAMLLIVCDFAAIALENARNYKKVEELTVIDDLTCLYNSRYLHMLLDQEVLRSARYHKEFSLIFLDLDRFKQVNDTHGHVHGSDLLRETGKLLQEHIRTVDFAIRYGGDEFVVLLPETGKAESTRIAERLRKTVEDHVFLHDKGLDIRFTASFGVASFPDDASTKIDLIQMADEAMYKGKHKNRNTVETA